MNSSFFWDVTQCRLVIPCRRFGTAYRSHLQGSGSLGCSSVLTSQRALRCVSGATARCFVQSAQQYAVLSYTFTIYYNIFWPMLVYSTSPILQYITSITVHHQYYSTFTSITVHHQYYSTAPVLQYIHQYYSTSPVLQYIASMTVHRQYDSTLPVSQYIASITVHHQYHSTSPVLRYIISITVHYQYDGTSPVWRYITSITVHHQYYQEWRKAACIWGYGIRWSLVSFPVFLNRTAFCLFPEDACFACMYGRCCFVNA